MAARKRKIRHDDKTRGKIQAAMIINRLQDGLAGKITLTAPQVSIGLGLLRKVLPDLQSMAVTSPDGSDLAVKHTVTIRYVDPIKK